MRAKQTKATIVLSHARFNLRSAPSQHGVERNSSKEPTNPTMVDSPVTFSGREAPHTWVFRSSLQRMPKIED
jgi:hypothetical protein